VVISFNKEIYKVLAIKEAVQAYKKICKLDLRVEKKYLNVYFPTTFKGDIDFICSEFCNYALALTKKYE